MVRKPRGKNGDEIHNGGQQVSVINEENQKLAVFLFHHQWRYTFDWKVKGVQEDTVYLLVGQKRFKDAYKDSDMLPKVSRAE